MPSCRIIFEDIQNNVIYSGQLLRGTIELTVNQETSLEDFYLRISGKTVYEKHHSRRTTKKTKSLFDTEIGLTPKEKNGDDQLSAGVHTYPFEFQLPPDLPSTVKAEYGYRNYKVRVYYRGLIKTEKACEEFIVVKPVDLNATPSLRMPLTVQLKKPICVHYLPFITSSGNVEIQAELPMSGYAPHQTINLEITINNQTDKAIAHCLVQLVKHVKCYLQGFSDWASVVDIDDIVVTEATLEGCGRMKDKKIYTDICIPETQPTDATSDMIAITYSIQITGVVPNFLWKDLVLDLPITIGSVPIMPK